MKMFKIALYFGGWFIVSMVMGRIVFMIMDNNSYSPYAGLFLIGSYLGMLVVSIFYYILMADFCSMTRPLITINAENE